MICPWVAPGVGRVPKASVMHSWIWGQEVVGLILMSRSSVSFSSKHVIRKLDTVSSSDAGAWLLRARVVRSLTRGGPSPPLSVWIQ